MSVTVTSDRRRRGNVDARQPGGCGTGLLTVQGMLPDHPDPTIDEFRAGYDDMFEGFPIDPDAQIAEVDAGGVRSLQVRVDECDAERHVVYFHGGGMMCGNPEGVRGTAARLARAARATVLVPDYRLAPEHAYPAALDDATAACRWLLSEYQGSGPAKLALLGDSAGGGLAISCAIRLRNDEGHQPAALVGWSPWVDMTVSGSAFSPVVACRFHRQCPVVDDVGDRVFARAQSGGSGCVAAVRRPNRVTADADRGGQ